MNKLAINRRILYWKEKKQALAQMVDINDCENNVKKSIKFYSKNMEVESAVKYENHYF